MNLDELEQVPQTVLRFMNEDHSTEFKLTGALAASLERALAGTARTGEVEERWAALALHTKEHFSREEASMSETDDPTFPRHRAEHERLLAVLEVRWESYVEARDCQRLLDFTRRELRELFVAHVTTMDSVTARYVMCQREAPAPAAGANAAPPRGP
jgi:hemerythrin